MIKHVKCSGEIIKKIQEAILDAKTIQCFHFCSLSMYSGQENLFNSKYYFDEYKQKVCITKLDD